MTSESPLCLTFNSKWSKEKKKFQIIQKLFSYHTPTTSHKSTDIILRLNLFPSRLETLNEASVEGKKKKNKKQANIWFRIFALKQMVLTNPCCDSKRPKLQNSFPTAGSWLLQKPCEECPPVAHFVLMMYYLKWWRLLSVIRGSVRCSGCVCHLICSQLTRRHHNLIRGRTYYSVTGNTAELWEL